MRRLALALVALVCAVPVYAAAPTRVQNSGWQVGSSVTSVTANLTGVVSGHLIVVGACEYTSVGRSFTATDNGSAMTQAITFTSSNSQTCAAFYTPNVASGSHALVVTVSGGLSSTFAAIAVEVAGASTTTPLQNQTSNEETASTSHTAAASSTGMGTDPYILVFGSTRTWTNTVTAGGSFSKVADVDTGVAGPGSFGPLSEDWSATGATSTTGPWTSDIARDGASVMVSFVGTGGGGGGGATPRRLTLVGVGG